jgi:ribosome-binding factor A
MAVPRSTRVGDQLRAELSELLMREVKDPGIGFLTITQVKVTPDIQIARVYYTTLGDDKARRDTQRALDRAVPFLRRQIARRMRLKRVPELEFFFDESIERGDRIERILHELSEERGDAAAAPAAGEPGAEESASGEPGNPGDGRNDDE